MADNLNDKLDGLPQLARQYCLNKRVVENRSPRTVEEYAHDLRTFFRYMRVQKENLSVSLDDREELMKVDITGVDLDFINSITTVDVYEFLIFAGDRRENEWAARARKLCAIKGFYKYITVKMHLSEHNPARDIEAPKPKKSLPKYMTLEETQLFLDTVASDENSKSIDRDYAIVTLFLNCGMRLAELVGINLGDIAADMSTLRVIGKGNKERMIYLNEACRNALGVYLTERSKIVGIKDTNALFISRLGKRMGRQSVQLMVYKYLKLAGLENRKLSVHKLRHTAATLMYRSGKVDVRVLKDILGHEQLNTTQIYTHVSDESMRAAMEANPISKIKK